ncbi:P-loop containing nucleoside triphosphate hydrolase protein [Gloeopeniophorella convolvens]|nr:P-loop containing nucleoside triphosphate hydrolase protein [Gloeopeniophorella convolvens]
MYSRVYSASGGNIRLREDQLISAIHFYEGRDVIHVSRTGSGKTMQIVIAALMDPKIAVLVLSPLMRLQESMADGLNNFEGINAVVVNHKMRYDSKKWTNIHNLQYNVIMASPEQCDAIDGRPTRLQQLLLGGIHVNSDFSARIKRVIVDEAHLAFIWGNVLSDTEAAFRPAWGEIGKLRIKLKAGTPLMTLTATAPASICAFLEKTMHLRSPILRKNCTNRPSQTYACHPIVGSLKDFRNLGMLIDSALSDHDDCPTTPREVVAATRKTVVFMDNTGLIESAHDALYAMLPASLRAQLRALGFIRFYHAKMSDRFLDATFDAFHHSDSTCKILFASSAFATGLDIPNIEVVIQYGVCHWFEGLLQRFGRNVRQGHMHGLSLLMYEPWALSPTTSKPSAKECRTSEAIKKYVALTTCRRGYIAEYLDDDDPEALLYDGDLCCDGDHSATHKNVHVASFDLQHYFPGHLLGGDPPRCEQPTSTRSRGKLPPMRPKVQQGYLKETLKRWLVSPERQALTPRFPAPEDLVLSESDLTALVQAPYVAFRTSADVASVIGQADEWASIYAHSILGIVQQFELIAQINMSQWTQDLKDKKNKRKLPESLAEVPEGVASTSQDVTQIAEAVARIGIEDLKPVTLPQRDDEGATGERERKRVRLHYEGLSVTLRL